MLSSDEELQGFYDELRGAGKEKEVVRMRVVLSKGEGADERGAPDQSGMDVELETTTATTTTAEKKDEDKVSTKAISSPVDHSLEDAGADAAVRGLLPRQLDTASATTEVHPAAQTKGINVRPDFVSHSPLDTRLHLFSVCYRACSSTVTSSRTLAPLRRISETETCP